MRDSIGYIFYALAAALSVWCAFNPSWQAVVCAAIMAAIGVVGAVLRPKYADLKQQELDAVKAKIDSMESRLEMYLGLGKE